MHNSMEKFMGHWNDQDKTYRISISEMDKDHYIIKTGPINGKLTGQEYLSVPIFSENENTARVKMHKYFLADDILEYIEEKECVKITSPDNSIRFLTRRTSLKD